MNASRIALGAVTALSLLTACGDDSGTNEGTAGGGGASTTSSTAQVATTAGPTNGPTSPASTSSDTSTSTGEPDSSSSTSGFDGICDEGFVCVPAGPSSGGLLEGYLALDAESCPGAAYEESYRSCDLDACECGEPTGSCDVDVFLASDPDCEDFFAGVEDGCTDVRDGDAYFYPLVGDECEWTTAPVIHYQGCALYEADAEPCDAGVCVPAAPEEKYCILVNVGAECPDEVYTEEHIDYTGGDAECSCYCYGDASCGDAVAIVSTTDDACTGDPQSFEIGTCTRVQDVASVEVSTVPGTSTTCTAESTNVSTSVSTTRLCCMP